jgi:hypothetical protein
MWCKNNAYFIIDKILLVYARGFYAPSHTQVNVTMKPSKKPVYT